MAKISVFISNFNHGHLLPRTLDSICIQEVPPDEIVIVDDCSTDNSLEVLDRYAHRYPFLRYFRYPEKSKDHIQSGLEQLQQLKGDYVHWFASDDKIYPGFYKAVKEAAAGYPGVGVICASFHHWGANETVTRINTHGFTELTFLHGPALQHFCKLGSGASGVASVTRLDAYQWLREHGYDELGQWMEFGLSVAAIRYGLVVIPDVYGAYTDFGPGYHTQHMYHETRCLEWFQKLRTFLRQPAFQNLLPPEVINSFEQAAASTFPPQTKLRLALNNWIQQASQLLQNGQTDQAGQIAQELTQRYPDFCPGWELLGLIYVQLGRIADAEQVFRRALPLNPQQASLHNNLGVCMLAQGKPQEALPFLARAIELAPGYAEAYLNLGDTLTGLQRFHEARDMYGRALQANPNLVQAQQRLDELQSLTSAAK